MNKKQAKFEAISDAVNVLKAASYEPSAEDFPREADRVKVSTAYSNLVTELEQKAAKLK